MERMAAPVGSEFEEEIGALVSRTADRIKADVQRDFRECLL